MSVGGSKHILQVTTYQIRPTLSASCLLCSRVWPRLFGVDSPKSPCLSNLSSLLFTEPWSHWGLRDEKSPLKIAVCVPLFGRKLKQHQTGNKPACFSGRQGFLSVADSWLIRVLVGLPFIIQTGQKGNLCRQVHLHAPSLLNPFEAFASEPFHQFKWQGHLSFARFGSGQLPGCTLGVASKGNRREHRGHFACVKPHPFRWQLIFPPEGKQKDLRGGN